MIRKMLVKEQNWPYIKSNIFNAERLAEVNQFVFVNITSVNVAVPVENMIFSICNLSSLKMRFYY